jgi:hypothetical protein
LFRACRNIARLTTVARTLARHGALAPFLQQIEGAGLAPAILLLARLFSREKETGRPGERLARALIDLGPSSSSSASSSPPAPTYWARR